MIETDLIERSQSKSPPVSAETLVARAKALAAVRPDGAMTLLAAALCLAPALLDVDMAEAAILLRAGRAAAACRVLDAALARQPGCADTLLLRAQARLSCDDAAGAARDAADAVVAAPGHAAAKAMLGVALADLGQFGDACACLREAVGAAPANPGFREALARAQSFHGEGEAARATLDEGTAPAPAHAGLRIAAIRLAIEHGDAARAEAMARAASAACPADACLTGLLGHALSFLGRHAEAGAAYAEALNLAPEDAYVRHLVATSGLRAPSPRAPDDYVRAVFDGYAARFESHIVQLGYRVPGLLRAAVLAHARLPEPAINDATGPLIGPVLDLGCGTGLAAVAMSDLPLGPWHGIDLSPRMLGEAAAKNLYASLREAEIESALAEPGAAYRLIVAGDVLCYFGALAGLLAGIAARLAPGGLAVASAEVVDGPGDWSLGPRGRYHHSPDYLRRAAAAAGLEILALDHEPLRVEERVSVPGLIIVLAKPGA